MNKFVELIPRQAAKYGNREALRYRDYFTQEWTSLSWREMASQIESVALAFAGWQLEPHGRVCVFSQNAPEILLTHFAAFYNRAVPVPIYATSSRDEAAYIVADSGASILMVGDQRQYDIALDIKQKNPSLKHIVTFDPAIRHDPADSDSLTWQQLLALGERHRELLPAVQTACRAGEPSDLMYLIYTSGTTGVPKGVMLTHSNFNAAMDFHAERLQMWSDHDVSLCFLPLSHIFELGWTMFCLTNGIHVAINGNPKEIQKAVSEIRPNEMCSVPRFWEKVYTAVNDNLQRAKPLVRMLVKRAISVGRDRNLNYVRLGKKPPFWVEKQYEYFESKVFRKLRQAIGVENGKLFPTAGAMLSDNITEFLHAIGINICIGYGLSETNATVSCFKSEGYQIGTVGTPIGDLQVRIGDQNEILLKGSTIMQGYFNKPEETAKAIDADGWFHTGDCGELTPDGDIIITERLKDLYKTSNGKYIAPQVLETLLGQDKYIEQVAIIGDGRKYVSALIVPAFEEIKAWAEQQKIPFESNEELVNDPALHEMLEARIEGYQQHLASYEQIKRFVILPRPFSMESGELTNTLKIKRAVINKRYAPLIDALYAADYRKKK
ncbi:MAG: long-chain fatty acid--CoA ligase [Muribaculaceae bacterium]|nr:long-chain fatty acid--CoA ligase [Muribaculaceae bacterium]